MNIEVDDCIYCPSNPIPKNFYFIFSPLLDFHKPTLTTFTLPPLALEWEIPQWGYCW